LIRFIGALDECEEDQVRDVVAFLEHLGELSVSAQCRFHVCFSSRHDQTITIKKGIQLILYGEAGHRDDPVKYVDSELKTGPGKLVPQIGKEILERASGKILWVVLVVKILNKEYDDIPRPFRMFALQKRLNEIT
jgi:hypothetical protein